MYTRTFVGILVVALILVPMAHANPLNAVKKAVGDVGGIVAGDAPAAASAASAGSSGGGGARPGVKKHDSYPPGVAFASLLNGITYRNEEGKITLGHINATFLSDDAKGYIILRKADGAELYKWDWEVDTFHNNKPYYLMGIKTTTDLRTGEVVFDGWLPVNEPGNYVLDFYLPDEHFYSYSFSISKLTGDDPFASKDRMFMDGDWEKWAYMFYHAADPEKSLAWKVWLRNKSTGSDRDAKPKIEVKRGGELICIGRDITITLQPTWNRFEFDLVFPSESVTSGQYFKAKDLLKQDGDYTLTMSLDDEVHGVWKFAVEGGKFKTVGRAARGQADPLTFIEGGQDAFWFCME